MSWQAWFVVVATVMVVAIVNYKVWTARAQMSPEGRAEMDRRVDDDLRMW